MDCIQENTLSCEMSTHDAWKCYKSFNEKMKILEYSFAVKKSVPKNGRELIFGKSRQLTLWIPWESKV